MRDDDRSVADAATIRLARAAVGGSMIGCIPALLVDMIAFVGMDGQAELSSAEEAWTTAATLAVWAIATAISGRLLFLSEKPRPRVATLEDTSDEGGLGKRSAFLHASTSAQHLYAGIGGGG